MMIKFAPEYTSLNPNHKERHAFRTGFDQQAGRRGSSLMRAGLWRCRSILAILPRAIARRR